MSDWGNRISTGAIAAVASLLIWTWAAEKTRESATVTGAVRIVSGEGQALAAEPDTPIPVTVQLKGSRGSLQRVADLIEGGAELKLGRGGVPATPGTFSVDLAAAIAALPELSRSDVSVESTRPDLLEVSLSKLVTQAMKITPVFPSGQVSGEATVDPPEATVTLPATLAERAALLRLEAPVDVRPLEPGRRYSRPVRLRLPEALQTKEGQVRVTPEEVTVTFTLRAKNSTTTVTSVPVQVAGPPTELAACEVQLDPGNEFLRNVTLTGPGDAISQIESGRFRVAAVVHLSADDLARRSLTRPVSLWLLPPGVTVTKVGNSTDLAPPVSLRISERPRTSAAPPAAPAGRN